MARVAAISAGPRSASPRGRRALSFCGLLGLSAIGGLHIRELVYSHAVFVMAGHSPSKTGVNALMSRPSTPLCAIGRPDVDARHRAGHDESQRLKIMAQAQRTPVSASVP